jgi:ABC-2 type transport system ATP-binding protein
MDTIVQVDGLRKIYGATVAVDEVSFEVKEGEIFGMVGPNGAGKTTTIECLEGLRKPDAGKVRVLGVDPQREGQTLRERTGMQLQESNLPERMKVWEALDLYASFYPRAADWRELLTQLGLEEKRNAPFSKLSGGQKQRLFIALALLPDPQLVFLDELTTGLDPQARHAIWDLVRDVRAKGKTVLLTTHFMEEAERLCDRVGIIDEGRLLAEGSRRELVEMVGQQDRVSLHATGDLAAAAEAVKRLEAVVDASRRDDGLDLVVHAARRALPQILSTVAEAGADVRSVEVIEPDLEAVFLHLTGKALRD